jgi:eukaryotic-like serine/threonine-protein kinase
MDRRGDQNPSEAAQAGSISLKNPQWSSQAMETKDLYEFGPFRADGRRKSLTLNGELVPLPVKAFDVLYALLQKPGQTVLKDQLMKEVWPDTFVEEGNLTQMVFLLRKALGETAGGQPVIVTVPRQGYRFVGDLTVPAAEAVLSSASTDHRASAPIVTNPRRLSPEGTAGILAVKPGLKNIWWIGAAIAIVSGFSGWVIAGYRVRELPTERLLVRYTIPPPENTSYRVGRISPDGRSLAIIGVGLQGKGRLWVRRLAALAAEPLATAEFWPFWSPDSRFIAFAQDGKLKRIAASGGAPQTICDAAVVIGGSWNRDETIIFSDGEVIYRVPAKGGVAQHLTTLDASLGETSHTFPLFLPDGQHFLYTVHGEKRESRGIYLGSLGTPDARIRLLDDLSNAEYAPALRPDSGYLLFARGEVLMAQRFAIRDQQLRGEAFPVVEQIERDPVNLGASFSASENGVLLVTATYRGAQVTWFDRAGKRMGTIGRPGLHSYPQISPDEQTVAVDEMDAERFSSDIWLFPVAGGSSRLTFDGSVRAIWSPDSSSLAFESLNTAMYTKTSAGTESQVLLLPEAPHMSDDYRLPCEWSRDGQFLIYSQRDAQTGYDLWMLPLFGNRQPKSVLNTEHNEWCGTLSPDNRWIAYASDESGRSEIYVRAFSQEGTGSERKWLVSGNGGYWPKWRRDGKELLYLDADRGIVGVQVAAGASFQHATPQPLFASGIRTPDARFDVTADGRRFLIPTQVTAANPAPVTVMMNWTTAIKP